MAGSFFRFTPLQKHPRFLVTPFVQVMQQIGFRVLRQLRREFVEPGKERLQIRFRIGSGHGFHTGFQAEQGLQNRSFCFGHTPINNASPSLSPEKSAWPTSIAPKAMKLPELKLMIAETKLGRRARRKSVLNFELQFA